MLIDSYTLHRQSEAASNTLINREMAFLKSAFHIGEQLGLVTRVPRVPKALKEPPARATLAAKKFARRDARLEKLLEEREKILLEAVVMKQPQQPSEQPSISYS